MSDLLTDFLIFALTLTLTAGAQCLDAPSGVVWAGERLEDSL